MSVKTKIEDGDGTNRIARVDEDKALRTACSAYPPLEKQRTRMFRQFLTVDGLSSGSSDMGIDGSVTVVEFWIPAANDSDRYITKLSFEITMATQPQFWEFADANTALANGIRLHYESPSADIDIHDAMLHNWDILRLALGTPSIMGGSTATVFTARHVGAPNDYGLIPVIDLDLFMPPFGIKLDKGTKERLILTIKDDCTSATTFNCIAYGFDRF